MAHTLPDNYSQLLNDLKAEIRQARLRATIAANAELLRLYWQIGTAILNRQEQSHWGDKVTAQLAIDLQREFPEMKRLSHRNIKYMRQFATAYPDFAIGQRTVAQLPWSHHLILLEKVKLPEERLFYMAKVLEYGWSRDILSLQVKANYTNDRGILNTAYQLHSLTWHNN